MTPALDKLKRLEREREQLEEEYRQRLAEVPSHPAELLNLECRLYAVALVLDAVQRGQSNVV